MNKQLPIVCRYTGIKGNIDLPSMGNKCLEYSHPLAHIDTVVDVITTRDYTRKLDNTVLAGCLLTILRHTKLLADSKNHPASMNAELSKAKKSYLLKACQLGVEYLANLRSTKFLPKVAITYYETEADACLAISAFMSTLLSELLDESDLVDEVHRYFAARPNATTFHGYRQETAIAQAREAMDAKREAQKAHAAKIMAEVEAKRAATFAAKVAKSTLNEINASIKACSPKGRTYKAAVEAGLQEKPARTLAQYLASAHILEKHVVESILDKIDTRIEEAANYSIRNYYVQARTVFQYYAKANASNSLSTSDLLDTIAPEVEEKPKLSLRDRLAAMKKGA